MRVAPAIELTDTTRKELKKAARSNTSSVRFARRAEVILLASQGMNNKAIAKELGIGRLQVARWRERFLDGGTDALRQDLPRGGRKVRVDGEEIVRLTTQSCPINATHWSTRSMAALAETSPATVRRIWRAHGLKPHRFATFKVSRDPKFVEKLENIVGLYMNPPENALVLSCDEKSQVRRFSR